MNNDSLMNFAISGFPRLMVFVSSFSTKMESCFPNTFLTCSAGQAINNFTHNQYAEFSSVYNAVGKEMNIDFFFPCKLSTINLSIYFSCSKSTYLLLVMMMKSIKDISLVCPKTNEEKIYRHAGYSG